MVKTNKSFILKIIIGTVLALALVTGIVIFSMPKNVTAVSVMECSVNPEVQFVLNSDNKVLSVICENADG